MADKHRGEILYTIADVARILQLNVQTVRKYARKGDIGAIKLGKQWRVPASAVEELLKTKPQTDTEQELNDGFQRFRIS